MIARADPHRALTRDDGHRPRRRILALAVLVGVPAGTGLLAEHAGVDGVVRPFDQTGFDHAITGFRLDGRHAPVAAQCMQCHKTRSFLTAKPAPKAMPKVAAKPATAAGTPAMVIM